MDITKVDTKDIPDFDILTGGFPCQPFSQAVLLKGFYETRSTLFFDVVRIIKEKQPKAFFLENVRGLLTHDNGKTFANSISSSSAKNKSEHIDKKYKWPLVAETISIWNFSLKPRFSYSEEL